MSIEVLPFEALIKSARVHNGLNTITGGQIDVWHRYGQDAGDWSQTSQTLVLTPATGAQPEHDLRVQRVLLSARCYGDTPYEAEQVYIKLVDWLRETERSVVAITGGNALVYYVIQLASPALGMDEDVRPGGGMPFYLVPLRAEVAEKFVT